MSVAWNVDFQTSWIHTNTLCTRIKGANVYKDINSTAITRGPTQDNPGQSTKCLMLWICSGA